MHDDTHRTLACDDLQSQNQDQEIRGINKRMKNPLAINQRVRVIEIDYSSAYSV
jgi:hypothetical protein